ncbi:MAG TPA: hypothetical protein PLK94_05280 [Alphaproteobacteria bacterium]|nr:hypothetical protein [Alphaproteobacteria bacterium]HOO50686.1 hypothetical protein [Alphaproteobacteria bacterium]
MILRAEIPFTPDMLRTVPITRADYSVPALAQYTPILTPDDPSSLSGSIHIGVDMRRFRKEFIVLSSSVPRTIRPDFNQYYTLVLALSLVNETAHYIQHRNGSLQDFYDYKQNNEIYSLCTLYALQQHVSDVEMLDAALRIEHYFIDKGAQSSLYALRLALEKMEVRDIYTQFRSAYLSRDASLLRDSLRQLYLTRMKINMRDLKICNGSRREDLPDAVLFRATEPAEEIFKIYFKDTHQNN